jgi:tetratricopeptide (TPR) repeat protein
MHRYLGEARAALAAPARGTEDADHAAAAALGLVSLALELSPRADPALELRARALLALRRYRDVADMLRDYIPSCSPDDAAATSSSSRVDVDLVSPDRYHRSHAGGFLCCCFDVSELKRRLAAGFSRKKDSGTGAQWRYLVLGRACFHLGLMEDAAALLQTGRRLASAAFRRESVCWSEDSFFPSPPSNLLTADAAGNSEAAESVSQLLAHARLLLRRRAAAAAALDAGLPAEAVRHFNKALDTRRRGGVLPHTFATGCLVGRAAAFRAAGRPADAIADCNRALALDPAFIPALRARADLLESVGALPDCLRDLDHLKLLYDAALRDGKLPGPSWRPQGGVRFGEIAGAHRALTGRIQQLRGRVAGAGGVDYHALLGVRRGCARSEVERAHLLLALKLKPERSVSFVERMEVVDEHRDLEAVRDQARVSALLLYRMLQKGYSFVMSAVLDEEAAERQRAKDDAAAAAAAKAVVPPVIPVPVPIPVPRTMVTAATAAAAAPVMSPRRHLGGGGGVFCRDTAAVGSLLSRGGGFDGAIPVNCQAMSC